CSNQGLPGRESAVPGRHNHSPACLELRLVGGKQQSLWSSPIVRGRAPQKRGSVDGQGLKQIRLDGRLGVRSIYRRQTCRRGEAQNLLSLPRGRQSSRLCLHSLRTLIPSIIGGNMAKVTYDREAHSLAASPPTPEERPVILQHWVRAVMKTLPPKPAARSRLIIGHFGSSDSALAASSGWRLRRTAADRHATRCASRNLCSGGAPRRYPPSKEITALLVIDPYNDFIAEGGKLWDRVKGVAEANECVPHMVQVLHAARQA